MKRTNFEIKEIIHSIEVIFSNPKMLSRLRESYATEKEFMIAGVKGDIIKEEAIELILKIAPTCYKIGDTVFLKGETKGDHDFVGDQMGNQTVTELFDMTTEIKSGHSYSFYVSTCDYFPLASFEEIIEVKDFLNEMFNKNNFVE
jgi:hypothetical protein